MSSFPLKNLSQPAWPRKNCQQTGSGGGPMEGQVGGRHLIFRFGLIVGAVGTLAGLLGVALILYHGIS